MKRKTWVRTLALSLLVAGTASAHAQGNGAAAAAATYPDKPIKFVVTFPPGGGTDVLARLIGAELTKSLGQTVVVDNKPGASGNIGAEAVVKSPADGYTLLVVNSSYAINPGVFSKMPFNPVSDLRGVVQFASTPSVISVTESSSLRNFQDLLQAARTRKDVSYASCGMGTPQHLAGGTLEVMASINLVHVAYKGCSPAMTDVVSKHVEVGINTLANTVPMVAGKKIRPLAVTSLQRAAALPDVPTVAEFGLAGYDVAQWFGILAPAKTPDAVVQKLYREVAKVMENPEIRARLEQQGYTIGVFGPEAFSATIKNDIERFHKVSKAIGLSLDN